LTLGDGDRGSTVVNKESELVAKRFFQSDMKVNEILTAVSFGEAE